MTKLMASMKKTMKKLKVLDTMLKKMLTVKPTEMVTKKKKLKWQRKL
jgi:hypothetical protein